MSGSEQSGGIRERSREEAAGLAIVEPTIEVVSHPHRIAGGPHLGVDAAMLLMTGVVALLLAGLTGPDFSLGWFTAFFALVLALFAYGGQYRPRFARNLVGDLGFIFVTAALAAMSVTAVRVVAGDDSSAAADAVRAWLLATVFLFAGHLVVTRVRIGRRRAGLEGDRTLIVGADSVGQRLAETLSERPEFGLKPVAFFDPRPPVDHPRDLPVFGLQAENGSSSAMGDLLALVAQNQAIDHVIFTSSSLGKEAELELIDRCERDLNARVSIIPRVIEAAPDVAGLEQLAGLPIIQLPRQEPAAWQLDLKDIFDRTAAFAAIVLGAPLLLVAAVGTFLTLGRPILYRQRRLTMRCHEFEMLKFRTMKNLPDLAPPVAESEQAVDTTVAPGGVDDESRRTRFGSFLRRTSIDELPQLFNVLRGDMAIIGPRPERPEYAATFRATVCCYGQRNRFKAGITGWAQVEGLRGRTSLAARAKADRYYIENWSLWLDTKIALRTLSAVVRGEGS